MNFHEKRIKYLKIDNVTYWYKHEIHYYSLQSSSEGVKRNIKRKYDFWKYINYVLKKISVSYESKI